MKNVINWANDTSSESPNVYWLFGQAGSGKSTIAYTIARRFELAPDDADTITLAGNFFCSRQFEETRESKCIIRTIAYHLALRCPSFANTLGGSKKINPVMVNRNIKVQLQDFLVEPWLASRHPDPSTPAPNYLIVIDALDEIDGEGGSEFLRALINVINKQRLPGLKFFVTSRSDPDLVDDVEKFKQKHRYRLQDVEEVEVGADIKTYLNASLPNLATNNVETLVTLAAGLFIYAATVVKVLMTSGRSEKERFLAELFATSNSSVPQPSSDATSFRLLDKLYLQVLRKAFHDFTPPKSQKWTDRLLILHTFLSTFERTSTSVVSHLLFSSDYTDVAEKLFSDLHAVLYTEHGRVLAYHKSFSDFLFDEKRSSEFWCDLETHHRLLTNSCFRVMKEGLQFNIANIPSSFTLDRENDALAGEVERNISSVLCYSCRNWDNHLSATKATACDLLHEMLSEFLQLRALFWIEVMNLLDSRGRCYPMFQTAREWVIESKASVVHKEKYQTYWNV